MGGDLSSSVVPVPLYTNVSPCSAGRFSFYLDPLFLPSQNVVPLCMQALSSTSVTMVLLRKSSSSRSSWNYLQLGFTAQPGVAGPRPFLAKPFPGCVVGQVRRQHRLQGTAVAPSPREPSPEEPAAPCVAVP